MQAPVMSHSREAAQGILGNQLNRSSESNEVEESALLRDLIFVFQGIDGKMIKFGAESGTCSIDPSVGDSCSLDDRIRCMDFHE